VDSSDPRALSEVERYREHVLVVDPDGSALLPTISRQGSGFSYHVALTKMEGEDTTKIDVAAQARCGLYKYLDNMFKAIKREKPDTIVIYIHGGLNNIFQATAKSAEMADMIPEKYKPGYSKIYPICICWDSSPDTYLSHLLEIRGGLHVSFPEGLATAPLFLASDLATAVVRAPVTWVKDLENDIYAANPRLQQRYRHTLDRYWMLDHLGQTTTNQGISVSRAADGREERHDALALDVGMWMFTLPTKLGTSLLIDSLGPEAWQVMLRRTRTMFERESEFVPSLDDTFKYADDHKELYPSRDKFRAGILDTSRKGAMEIFLSDAEAYLNLPSRNKPYNHISLIGHSMGAIISNEILQSTTRQEIPNLVASGSIKAPIVFDNIEYLAAACTIRDFKRDAIPYMEMHPGVHFHNLSLHDNAERSEKNSTIGYDLTPRGSLLVWIDSFLDDPASEDDRTLGRWENSILMTDDLPSELHQEITLKSFGRDRLAANGLHNKDPKLDYTIPKVQYGGKYKYIVEPTAHGSFSSIDNPGFAFWDEEFWGPESAKDSPPPAQMPKGVEKSK